MGTAPHRRLLLGGERFHRCACGCRPVVELALRHEVSLSSLATRGLRPPASRTEDGARCATSYSAADGSSGERPAKSTAAICGFDRGGMHRPRACALTYLFQVRVRANSKSNYGFRFSYRLSNFDLDVDTPRRRAAAPARSLPLAATLHSDSRGGRGAAVRCCSGVPVRAGLSAATGIFQNVPKNAAQHTRHYGLSKGQTSRPRPITPDRTSPK